MLLPPAALALPLGVLLIVPIRPGVACQGLDHHSRHGDSINLERFRSSISRGLFDVTTGVLVVQSPFWLNVCLCSAGSSASIICTIACSKKEENGLESVLGLQAHSHQTEPRSCLHDQGQVLLGIVDTDRMGASRACSTRSFQVLAANFN
jgi:hypothetical protein